jgi:hypothetical protein
VSDHYRWPRSLILLPVAMIGSVAGTALGTLFVALADSDRGSHDSPMLLVLVPLVLAAAFVVTFFALVVVAMPLMHLLRLAGVESLAAYVIAAALAAVLLTPLFGVGGNDPLPVLLGYAVPTAAAFWTLYRAPTLREEALAGGGAGP